jgi:hypothetical protein
MGVSDEIDEVTELIQNADDGVPKILPSALGMNTLDYGKAYAVRVDIPLST